MQILPLATFLHTKDVVASDPTPGRAEQAVAALEGGVGAIGVTCSLAAEVKYLNFSDLAIISLPVVTFIVALIVSSHRPRSRMGCSPLLSTIALKWPV
jgi:hypothetical protein